MSCNKSITLPLPVYDASAVHCADSLLDIDAGGFCIVYMYVTHIKSRLSDQ